MKNKNAPNVSTDNELSISQKICAFVAFHIMFIPPILVILGMVLGKYNVTIMTILLYTTFSFWSGDFPLLNNPAEYNYGNPWRKFSEDFPLFHTMRSYLQLNFGQLPKELLEAEKKVDAQFIFAVFPHGCSSEFRILIEGMMQNVLPNVYHKLRTLTASVLFKIPIVREIALWTGCVNANRKTAELNLDRGNSLLVLPGGMNEQLMTESGKEKVYLKKRKGFIKLAMRKRVQVVPMYVFGSSNLFVTSKFLYGFRFWLMKTLGICIPLCRGLFGSPFCPLPKKVTVVFGAPLTFEMKGDCPTEKELDLAHDEFMTSLRQLFDKHKSSYGYGDRQIEIL